MKLQEYPLLAMAYEPMTRGRSSAPLACMKMILTICTPHFTNLYLNPYWN